MNHDDKNRPTEEGNMKYDTVNPPIICIAQPAWSAGNYVKSTVKIMSELARWHDVLYVDYPFTWKDVFLGIKKPGSKPTASILGLQNRLKSYPLPHGKNIHVLTLPPFIPVTWIKDARRYDSINYRNSKRALPVIRKAAQQLQFQNPIVISAFNPTLAINLIDAFDEQKRIYYCYDEIQATKWAGKHGGRLEAQYLPQTHALITTSEPLRETKSSFQSNAFTVKNGVDFDHFHQAVTLRKKGYTSRPFTFGYLGAIDDRLDYDLLISMAQALPHAQFMFVGPEKAHESIANLKSLPNTIFTGNKSPEELPQVLSQMDVGLIPFVRNEFTINIYPMKINEYLAAGLPVISTNFGDMRDFEETIFIHEQTESFTQSGFQLSQGISEDLIQRGIEFARQNSWTNRAAHFSQILQQIVGTAKVEA